MLGGANTWDSLLNLKFPSKACEICIFNVCVWFIFKGASCMVIKKPDDKGHDPIEFPYINRNLKLKKLDCPNGELMLGHR